MVCKVFLPRVFANGPGDLGSITGRDIPKTQKMVLDAISLNTQHYKVLSRVKWSNPGKGVAPSPTPRCIEKGSFGLPSTTVANFIYIYIYIYINIYIYNWKKNLTDYHLDIINFCWPLIKATKLLR